MSNKTEIRSAEEILSKCLTDYELELLMTMSFRNKIKNAMIIYANQFVEEASLIVGSYGEIMISDEVEKLENFLK